MRQRRIEGCLLRAGVALDAGCTDDARETLEEVRRLGSSSSDLARLELRLAQAPAPIAAAAFFPAQSLAPSPADDVRPAVPLEAVVVGPIAPVPSAQTFAAASDPKPHRRPLVMSLAAFAVVMITGWGGWQAMRPARSTMPSRSAAESSAPAPASLPIQQAAHADVVLPKEPDSVTVGVKAAEADPLIETPVPLPAKAEATRPDVKPTVAEPERTPAAAPMAPSTPAIPMPPAAAPLTTGLAPPPVPSSGTVPAATSETAPAPAKEAEPAPAVTPRTPPEISAPAVDESARVRAVLAQYEAAYSGLDAAAARAVWPGLDERALARAFDGLQSQQLSLGRCDVSVNGGTARADCSGSATWTPKVGGGGRTQRRRWRFDLQNAGGGWQIARAEAR